MCDIIAPSVRNNCVTYRIHIFTNTRARAHTHTHTHTHTHLTHAGYIYNGVLNTTRMKTCIQCPDQSVLVGTALNADPYGIGISFPPFRFPDQIVLGGRTLDSDQRGIDISLINFSCHI